MTVLVLRPRDKVDRTARAMRTAGIPGACVALMETRQLSPLPAFPNQTAGQYIILTSTKAAAIAVEHYSSQLKLSDCVSIGSSTASVLAKAGIISECPAQSDSEGVLNLPAFAKHKSQAMAPRCAVIMKGEGGRNTLSKTLEERGFIPVEMNLYRRTPLNEPYNSAPWQQSAIQYLAATSGEQIALAFKTFPAEWLNALTWITVSERTAQIAKKFGVQRLAVSSGASDNALITTLKTLMEQ